MEAGKKLIIDIDDGQKPIYLIEPGLGGAKWEIITNNNKRNNGDLNYVVNFWGLDYFKKRVIL